MLRAYFTILILFIFSAAFGQESERVNLVERTNQEITKCHESLDKLNQIENALKASFSNASSDEQLVIKDKLNIVAQEKELLNQRISKLESEKKKL